MKAIALVILLPFCNQLCFAQTFPKQTISLSYFGETVKHPGLTFGIRQNLISYKNKGIEVTKIRHLFQGGASLSFYTHRKSHLAISITPEVRYQFLFKRGFTVRLNTGLGYMRQFNYGTTYEIASDNTIKEINFAGRNKFTTSFSLGVGQNLLKRKNTPWGWHFDFGIFTESPTNTGFVPHIFISTGLDYYFNRKNRKL